MYSFMLWGTPGDIMPGEISGYHQFPVRYKELGVRCHVSNLTWGYTPDKYPVFRINDLK